MKIKLNLITLVIISFQLFGFTQQVRGQGCYGDYPTYYAKKLVYLYQNIDMESAIVGEIPKGNALKVINSDFGSIGFWEVCYDGKIGYAKNDQLSYKPISVGRKDFNVSTSTDTSDKDQDVGFNPFLAYTTTTVNFRFGPSSASERIKTLEPGSTVYVYSDKSINGYYKVIDVMTSDIGWVHNNYVKYIEKIEINEQGAFQSTGYSSTYNSEVEIENKSRYNIKLVVGAETFSLTPESTKTVEIKPGRLYYIASAPGVIPASGYQSFESNNGYQWSFWVATSR